MSNIDPTKPTTGTALTADIRSNFAIAKAELEVLQDFMNSKVSGDSPVFTGTTQLVNAIASGTLAVNGLFSPSAEAYVLTQTPAISAIPAGNISVAAADGVLGGLKFNKTATGTITLSGAVTVTFTTAGSPGRIVNLGLMSPGLYNPLRSIQVPVVELAGYGCYCLIKADGSVWLGFLGNTGPGMPYATTVFFSGSYRISP